MAARAGSSSRQQFLEGSGRIEFLDGQEPIEVEYSIEVTAQLLKTPGSQPPAIGRMEYTAKAVLGDARQAPIDGGCRLFLVNAEYLDVESISSHPEVNGLAIWELGFAAEGLRVLRERVLESV